MSIPQHIPIHPRFTNKNFKMAPPENVRTSQRFAPAPSQHNDDHNQNWSNGQSEFNDDEFDLFEVPVDNQKGDDVEKSGKPYDVMIIIMAVVIIILIIAVIWLMLANNDEIVSEKIVQPPQYMRPPGEMMGYPQSQPPLRYPQQQCQPQYLQPQQHQPQQSQPQQSQPQQHQPQQHQPQQSQQQPPCQTSKSEMDSVYQALKKKSEKNEKLSIDQYTTTQQPIVESVAQTKKSLSVPTLETIIEDVDEEYDEEYTYNQNNEFESSE